ncbi:MAG: phosphotransferase [Planctomycetes bacterium]|nr:phosphotransferase [Planctomycetota bacterium]
MSNELNNKDELPELEQEVAEEIDGQELVMILSRYDIGAIQRIKDYKKGSRHAPKLVICSTKGRYLLKRRAAGRDNLDRVHFSHAVQKELGDHRFPVAGLIETIDGKTLVEKDGRIYELFHFIHGHRFDKSNPAAADSGRVLAHCHDLLRDFSDEPAVYKKSYHQIESTQKALSEMVDVLLRFESVEQVKGMEETTAYIGEQYEDAKKVTDSVGFSTLPTSVVHGDWHPGNMLYQDGDIVAVIDFDSLQVAQRITDLANGVLQFSMRMGIDDVSNWPDSFRGHTIRSMVQGYNAFTTSPLLPSELSIIPPLMKEALIVESVFHVHKTGSFGTIAGSDFLRMIARKLKWLKAKTEQIVEVIQPHKSSGDSFE